MTLRRTGFFAELPSIRDFGAVTDPASYQPVPTSWSVVLTDVRGSTRAIEAGRYKDVNALGAASIVAALNAAPDQALPFVFGGDGATILVPPEALDAVAEGVRGAARMAIDAFGLELRAGVVPVADLLAEGRAVRVARLRLSEHVALAMFAGGGLARADALVKSAEMGPRYALSPAEVALPARFAGFECRWQPIPNRRGAIVSLIVQATGATEADRFQTYQRTLAHLDTALAGRGLAAAHPVALATLNLASEGAAFEVEARVRTGRPGGLRSALYRRSVWLQTRLGARAIRRGAKIRGFDGATYPIEVLTHTDFRKFDDALRMVLDLTEAEHATLVAALTAEHAGGHLAFGTFASSSALMTCLIFDRSGEHVHFVDGGDGGYALAARQLKAQLGAHPDQAGPRFTPC